MRFVMNEGGTAGRPLITLQQVCIPHYRRRLYDTLGADPRFRFQVLADPGAAVPFLPLAEAPRQCEFQAATQYVIRLPYGFSLSWQPTALAAVLRRRPDLIVAQGSPYDLTAWMLTIVGRITGLPVLLWTHGLQADESGVKWTVRSLLYRLSRGLLLYGDHAKRLLISKGLAADRLHVIYNSLDSAEQSAVSERITFEDCERFRRSLGIGADERLVCFTGRLQPVKRLPWLLQALNIVVTQGKKVHLVLVGEGSDRPQLEALSTELGLNRWVHFLGAMYDESRLGLVLSASDLAVVPSGAGLSVMHALAYGTPVLLHDHVEEHFPEWEAVKERETGWFYRNGDLSDCARKIVDALFPNPQKPTMAVACRAMITHRYNSGTHAALFIDAIAKYCSLPSPGGTESTHMETAPPPAQLEHSAR
ncbi:MAG: glycosyltransferase family 4 protein [Nitrospira sp.]